MTKTIPPSGFIFVSKPSGITSSQLVLKVKKKLNLKKIGHTGTLDKAAEGLMILPYNNYTCFADKILGKDKEYVVTIQTGLSTDSGDLEGNVLEKWEWNQIEDFFKNESQKIRETISSILAWKTQIPPKVSALKKNGKRYSDLFRSDQEFEVKERKITIHSILILKLSPHEICLQLGVSSGTYIRKIVQDLGQLLGIPLVVSSLKRISIGRFQLEHSNTLDEILGGTLPDVSSLDQVYPLPKVEVDDSQKKKIQNGNPITMEVPLGEFLFTSQDGLLAWCISKEQKFYKFLKVF